MYASGAQDVNHLDEDYGELGVPDIMDNAYVIIDYDSGARASLDLCMFAEASHAQEEVCIVGDKGKLEAFLPQSEVRTGIRGVHKLGMVETEVVNDGRIRYDGHHHGSSYLEHLDIADTVRAAKRGAISRTAGPDQGLLSVAIGVAAQTSIAEDRPVRLRELVTASELGACRFYATATN